MKRISILAMIIIILNIYAENKLMEDSLLKLEKELIHEFLKKNLIEIEDVGMDKDNAEFNWINNVIGNSRIVMLGEQDHGDATAFEVKARLVKYLHEEMGFNVLAFESDFYQINQINDIFINNKISLDELKNNALWDFWTKDKNIQEFYHYLENCNKTNNPIFLTGFDCQFTNWRRDKYFLKNYLHYIIELNDQFVSAELKSILEKTITDLFTKPYNHEYPNEQKVDFLRVLTKLIELKEYNSSKNNQNLQDLKNLKGHVNYKWSDRKNRTLIRDQQMFENFKWLYENKFKGEKVIIWAHNGHIPKDYTSVISKEDIIEMEKEGFSMNFIGNLMGELLYREYGNEIYSVGFISYSGEYSNKAYQYNFQASKEIVSEENSLEYLINSMNTNYGFINLRNSVIPEFIISDEHNEPGLTDWSKV